VRGPWHACFIVASVVASVAGCVRTDTEACSADVTCRAGTACVEARDDFFVCVPEDARHACTNAALPDGASCREQTGRCYDGACVPIACGDELVDPGEGPAVAAEMCDDGNTVSGDGCSADCRSDESCGNGVVDPVTNEVCDDGNAFSNDGCDVTCSVELPTWTRIQQRSPPPFNDPAMAFDPIRGEAILFGDNTFSTQTFKLNTAWTIANPTLQPVGRTGGAMVFDAARRVIVLVGGDDPDNAFTSLSDTWTWNGREWNLANIEAGLQRARAGLAYDAKREKVVLFGGARKRQLPAPLFFDDTWEWNGASWTKVETTVRPSARADMAMAYDPSREVTVMFGGIAANIRNAETWEYDGTSWTQKFPPVSPPALDGAQMVAYHGKLLLFGGSAATGIGGARNDTWLYDGVTWEKLPANTTVSARSNHALIYDTSRDRVVAFGGSSDAALDSSTFVFEGEGWKQATFSEEPPAGVPAVTVDAARGRTLVSIESQIVDVAGTYQLVDDAWTKISDEGRGAPEHVMAFDRARDRGVMFGGAGDTWTFAEDRWTLVSPRPSPSPALRQRHAMTFDREREEVVLYGGLASGAEEDDTWAWNGSAWAVRSTAGAPGSRNGAALGYDPIRKQTILFGGSTSDDQTFAWDGTTWTVVGEVENGEPVVVRPLPRQEATMTWNPNRRRLTMFGGQSPFVENGLLDDAWEWTGTRWIEVPVTGERPEPRHSAGFVPDGSGIGLYVFAGSREGGNATGDLWRLSWSNATPRDRCLDQRDSDGDMLLGCADLDCWAVCNPMCEPGVDCTGIAQCGDGADAPTETCRMCPDDSPNGACEICGDAFCGPDETDCAIDCGP
jgi:cysteine-rich repeat protein